MRNDSPNHGHSVVEELDDFLQHLLEVALNRDDLPEEVEFVAKFTFQLPFTQHPTVKQLQALVDQARKNPAKTITSPGRDKNIGRN